MKIVDKFLFGFGLIMTVILVVSAAEVAAQADLQADRLRAELERTDEVIDRAKEAVRSTNVPAAALALQEAIDLQQGAWGAYRNRRMLMASRGTMQARELAKQALVRCRVTEQGESVVLSRLELAAELLQRAGEVVGDGQTERLSALYSAAKDNLNRAWEFYRSHRYRPALKLANQVNKAAREMLDIGNRHARRAGEFERLSETVSENLQKLQESFVGCTSDEARQLSQQAEKRFDLARALANEGEVEQAMRSLQDARRLAVEASRLCNDGESLRSRHRRLTGEADRLAESVPPGEAAARELLDRVYNQLRLAEDSLDEDRTEAAAAALRAAYLGINQIKNILGMTGQ